MTERLSPSDSPTTLEPPHKAGGLSSISFIALLVTQFLGALNDNMFRWLVVPIGKYKVGDEFAAAALSAGLACFVVPYIALAAPAGYLADRFSKRSVIIGCKVAELIIMLLGVTAIFIGNIYFLFVVIALMGSQSALFGPSKFGSIPELLRAEKISAGNGLVGLTTVMAVVGGSVAGNYLYDWTGPDGRNGLWISALALTGVAGMGWFVSHWVQRCPAADPKRPFPFNAPAQTYRDLANLAKSTPLLRVAFGIAFFWSLASLAQMNVDLFGVVELGLKQKDIGPLLGVLSLGVGLGSVLAGIWSAGRVELGLVPLGALGVALSAMLLFTVPDPTHASSAAYAWTCVWLGLLGMSAGLFDVPLASYMQHRSPAESRGSFLAASNFLTFSGMLLAAGLFYVLRTHQGMTARGIFLLSGVFTLPVAAYAFIRLPQATLRCAVWLASHSIYRVRVHGRENLPEEGGALLVANHVSWLDGVLLLMTSSRPIRMVVDADLIRGWWIRWLAKLVGAIPIRPSPKAARGAIDAARQSLRNGELVCIFPEGGITRTGQLQGFKPGLMKILRGTSVPMVPVYLDELWGSIFSFRGGRFFWKLPRHWPYPVSIWFGRPVENAENVNEVRQAVQDLGAEAVQKRKTRTMTPPSAMLRMCRKATFRNKIADSSGAQLRGSALLMRVLILRRLLLREVFEKDERYVGLLLPPSVGGVVVNAAVTLAGRVAANLNYTVSSKVMNACIEQAQIRHVLTSRKVTEKLDLEIDAPLVYLEDFASKVTWLDKLAAAVGTFLLPMFILERWLGLHKIKGDDVLTVIFTSGSTGQPKGVLLTHHNVASNVDAIDQVVQLRPDDVIMGVLPFFHSFGFTVTLWTVLGLDIQAVYHFTPLDARQVGKLCERHGATVLIATPTFLRSYLKRCSKQDFAAMEVVVVGAEPLPVELAAAFEEKFGVRPVEGYGATELSPLVSVNVPASRSLSAHVDCREGSVGRPVPGVSAKVVDPDASTDQPVDAPGMLMIKGPNVMQGYLGLEEKTAEVIKDGWYVTGDIAQIDRDGFIHITGRLSRFSKIGGEMVPHIRIEEAIQKIVASDEDEILAVVTAVPDPRKGERLIVIHTELSKSPAEICQQLSSDGMPNLWIPSPDSFIQVEKIPLLGTGKLDLKGIAQLARDRLSQTATG